MGDNVIIKKLTKDLLKEIGENPDREGLLKTPHRVAKSWEFFSRGYKQNIDEIINKEKQGCTKIFLCPVFKTKKNKSFLGTIKFNLIRLCARKDIIALGGINKENIKYLKMCNIKGIAAISWIKKNGPSINTGPF